MDGIDPTEIERARRLLARIRADWLARPRVTGMDVGFRERGGVLTSEIALRVYVSEKRPPEELAPGEAFPETIEGVRVDVIVFEPRAPRAPS